MILLLLACTPASDSLNDDPQELPGDNFGDAATVRFEEPFSGQTVDTSFKAVFAFGDEVQLVRVLIDDEPATSFESPGKGTLNLTADTGRHTLTLVGFDGDRAELSRDTVDIRVVDEDAGTAWVGITTPSDGAHPMNPVVFSAEGSAGVTRIEFLADDWSIGEVKPGGSFSYSFAGVGFERTIKVQAYDEDEMVATDSIRITVEESTVDPGPTDFNELVEALVEAYPKDGTYQYYWPADGGGWSGSTRDMYYQGEKVTSHGGFSSCYCSGITFEWYLRAFQEWDKANGGDGNDLNGIDQDEIWDFRRDWYVRDVRGPGTTVAMEAYGVGVDVGGFENWQRGDFVQLWRYNGSGHTVVFWDWVLADDGSIVGMEYASCQNATNGLGINEEYFGSSSGSLDPQYMWAARGWLPELWY
jgi:hypothetical protein